MNKNILIFSYLCETFRRKKVPCKIYCETQSSGFTFTFFLEFNKFHSKLKRSNGQVNCVALKYLLHSRKNFHEK